MIERGMIFNTEMVPVLVDGRKMLTRRPVNIHEAQRKFLQEVK